MSTDNEEADKSDVVENNGVENSQEQLDGGKTKNATSGEDVTEQDTPTAKTRSSARTKKNATVTPVEPKRTLRGRAKKQTDKDSDTESPLKNEGTNNSDAEITKAKNSKDTSDVEMQDTQVKTSNVVSETENVVEESEKETEKETIKESEKDEAKINDSADGDDDIEEIPVIPKTVPVLDVSEDEEKTTLENMIVIDECKPNADVNKPEEEPDTEMVSEDELEDEKSIENVSDEELPAPSSTLLPETEDLSEDEMQVDKKKKLASPSPTQGSKKSSVKEEKVESCSNSSATKSNDKKRKKSESSESVGSKDSKSDEPPSKKAVADSKCSTSSRSSSGSSARKYVPELEKYWKAVKEDATDFTGWTYLLQYVDLESNVEHAREAYDAFLSRYPYCYGYWRKYADFEKRKGSKDHCEEVFVRGLDAIPLSVDLWLHYLNYFKSSYPDDEEAIRNKYEKAIQACGLEFRSDRLWESYIKWETEKKKLVNVTAIYDKLLAIPTQNYTIHFERFQDHVMKNVPNKILSVDDFLNLRREVLQILKQYDSPLIGTPGGDDAPPGEEEAISDEKDTKSTNEETAALRDKIISTRRKVHKSNADAVTQRWKFEEGIKRPYFHVKPLERCQLENWRSYLEYEISNGDMDRIIILFERCLIACALYEEFWLKYILFLEKQGDEWREKLEHTYRRACSIHHVKKPNLHLHWAIFEETQGNFDKAAEILSNLEKSFPSLIQIAFRRINLERRRKAYPKVCELYEHYISSSTHSKMGNNMIVKYARFCAKILQDVDKGIKVLEKALEKDKDSPRLYFQILDLSMQKNPINVNEVVKHMDRFLSKESADPEQKLMIAQHKVEFLEDFGLDAFVVQKAHNEFLQYIKLVKDNKKKTEEIKLKTEPQTSTPAPSASFSSSSSSSKHTSSKTAPSSAPSMGPQNMPVPAPYGHSNHMPPYGGAPMAPYPAGQYPNHPPAPPYGQGSFNPPYNQGDSNFSNYQNWGYGQSGYGNYNQGWTGVSGGGGGGGFNY